jgi:hypothetical protein
MRTESAENGTTVVVWTFSSAMKYPTNIMMLFMNFEKMLGSDMEISLQNLKAQLKKNQS